MKIKEGFILRKVAGKHVVVAIGPASKLLNGMIKLNDTGAFCWNYLLKGISEDDLGGGACVRIWYRRRAGQSRFECFLGHFAGGRLPGRGLDLFDLFRNHVIALGKQVQHWEEGQNGADDNACRA